MEVYQMRMMPFRSLGERQINKGVRIIARLRRWGRE